MKENHAGTSKKSQGNKNASPKHTDQTVEKQNSERSFRKFEYDE
jgi:hypothetical protein